MRMLCLAAAASLVLSGCTTTSAPPLLVSTDPVDAAVQTNLPKICANARTAHLLFVFAAGFGRFSERTIATEAAAWEALEPLCVDPSAETSGRVLNAAVRAYSTIKAARAAG